MADFIFNQALGKVAYLAGLPAASDALVVVLLEASGIDSDATMRDLDTLDAVLSGSNEATFTGYTRKSLTSATVTVSDGSDSTAVDIADQSWTPGAAGNALGKLLVCYSGNTGTDTDSNIIPLLAYDFSVTPANAVAINAVVDSAGLLTVAQA
jgi:hypothetical protein